MRVSGFGEYDLLGETLDDAAGEAFDKSAKLLGLGYPGGALLAQLAARGRAGRFKLPRPMLKSGDLDFSFSGLKTAVLTLARLHDDEQSKADIAHAAQAAIVDVLVHKSMNALVQTKLNRLVVAGGVGANSLLRERLHHEIKQTGGEVFFPKLEFCTDNGAMIAFAAANQTQPRDSHRYLFDVKPRWDLQQRN